MLVIGFVALMVVMCLLKLMKNKNYGNYNQLYDSAHGSVNKIFSKVTGIFKSLLPKKVNYNQPQYEPEPKPEPEPIVEQQ